MRPAPAPARLDCAVADWVIDVIGRSGYIGIALLMFAENLFPPLPSELIMPFAGFLAARGELHWAGVLAAGVFGSVAGGLPWYWAGRKLGARRLKRLAQRHGRWVAVTPDEIDGARRLFERHGGRVLVIGRLVPALRTVVALPAGLARMPVPAFIGWTCLGSTLWTGLLMLAGYLLDSQYERIEAWLNPVSTVIFAAIAIAYAVRVWRHPSASSRKGPEEHRRRVE